MKLLYNTHVFLQFALAEFQAEFFAVSKQFIVPINTVEFNMEVYKRTHFQYHKSSGRVKVKFKS